MSRKNEALMSSILPEPPLSPVPDACPFCRSPKIGTSDEKAGSSAYWRCEACGEVWNVARLRAPSRYGYEGRRNEY
jgi:transposase-like protein